MAAVTICSDFGAPKNKEIKKIRDTNGTFHAKMGSIKDRNGMDLTEAEEYTEELYKKDLHNLDSIFKSRDITLLTMVHLVKAMIFPVVTYAGESWTVKKAEC